MSGKKKMQKEAKPGYKKKKTGRLPEGWEKKEFGNFVILSKNKYNPQNNDVKKCIELEHIEQETGILLDYTYSNFQKSTKNVFTKGDVLFGKLRPYLRKYWLAKFDGVCSSELWVLRPKNKCLNKYLFYIVQLNEFLRVANVTTGSKMPRSDWDYVSEFPFLLPPLPEQKKIAEILSTWDEAIEKTRALIAAKEKLKKALMQQLLTGKRRFREFQENNWKKIRLKEVSNISVSNVDKKINEKEKFVFLCNYLDVYNNNYINKEMRFMRATASNIETKKFSLLKGDVIITKDSETPDDIAKPAVVIDNLNNVLCGYHLAIIRPQKNKLHGIYLMNLLSYSPINHQFSRKANGVTRFGLGISSIENATINLPEFEEQQKIAEVFITIDKEIELLNKKLDALQRQKKGLMQVLLTGKVRVKV